MNNNLVKKCSPHQNQILSVQRDSFSACFGEIYIYIYIPHMYDVLVCHF